MSVSTTSIVNIPMALRELIQWLVWRYEYPNGPDEPKKVPYCATEPHRRASVSDRLTWATCEEALATMLSDHFDGIGFVFTAADPNVGIDLDDCRDAQTGDIEPWAQTEINRFNSYSEISPSGTGIHIIVEGSLPGLGRKTKAEAAEATEIYNKGRYFAFTGDHLDGSPFTIEPRQSEIDRFLSTRFPQDYARAPAPPKNGENQSRSRISIARRASRYVAKMPPSISKQRGHDRCYAVVMRLIQGFGLLPDEARPIMHEFSARCSPPWSYEEIEHKLRQAVQNADPDRIGELANKTRETPEIASAYDTLTIAVANGKQAAGSDPEAELKPAFPLGVTLGELLAHQGEADPGELIKDRFICRGSVNLLVGPTGIGKSAFIMQAQIHWAIGQSFFGMTPTAPLKSVTLQAENDMFDLVEMAGGVVKGLELSEVDAAAVRDRVKIFTESSIRGDSFAEKLRAILEAEKPDMAFIDPAFAYIEGDANRAVDVAAFMRGILIPLAQKHDAAVIVAHHSNKPPSGKEKVEWQAGDFAYLGAGSAEWVNASRACLAIRNIGSDSIFEFRAAKRGRRLHWVEDDGQTPTNRRYIAHAAEPGVICWRQPTEAETEAVLADAPKSAKRKGGRAPGAPDELILVLMRDNGGRIRQSDLVKIIVGMGVCARSAAYRDIGGMVSRGFLVLSGGTLTLSKSP